MSALAPQPRFTSFKFETPGTRIRGTVVLPPEDSQVKKFGTEILDTWPDGKPVMQTRIVLMDAAGNVGAIYAKGKMAQAIRKALSTARAKDIELGGDLTVLFSSYGTPKPGAQPPKLYEASYVLPPAGYVAPDLSSSFGDDDEPPF